MASAEQAVAAPQVIPSDFISLKLMGARLRWVEEGWAGYLRSDTLLVGVQDGKLVPIPVGDDMGLFVAVPKLAAWTGLPLYDVLTFLFLGLAVLGSAIGIYAVSRIFSTWLTRAYGAAVIIFAMAMITFVAGDTYIIGGAAVLAILPLAAVIGLSDKPLGRVWLALLPVAGFAGIALSEARYHATTGSLIAITLAILLHRATAPRWRAVLVAALAVGAFLAMAGANTLIHKRDAYLTAQRSDYTPIFPTHVLWHSIYLGFAFLENPYGIHYADDYAVGKAQELAPSLAAKAIEEWQYDVRTHEQALRQAVFDFARGHLFFVVKTVFAKAGVMVLFVLAFANLGLLGLPELIRRWRLALPLSIALGMAAMPGLLVLPLLNYIANFIAVTAIIGALGFGMWRQR